MKKRWMLLLVVLAFSILFIAGCKDDDNSTNPTENPMEVMKTYMDANGMAIGDLLSSWIISPDSLVQVLDQNYVMDIRSGDYHGATAADPADGIVDFENGHIEGAVSSSLSNIVTDAVLADKPIVVVCYSGQSAGHAVMALRLSNYSDARVLLWGMSGWHLAFDKWTSACNQLNNANWVAAPGAIEASEVFEYPEFDSELEEGAGILAERVAYMLEEGFKGVAAVNSDANGVLDDPSMYFINNFWGAADVETYGNVSGAYRINPLVLENLDPNETVVTYCWTGQTSSMITAYLTVLGYDAKSLKNGSNSMIYDALTAHKWSAANITDHDYIVGP